MRKEVEIVIENTQQKIKTTPGFSLLELAQIFDIKLEHQILGAMVNNQLKELDYEVYSPKTIRFIDITHPAGMRMYHNSLFFVLQKATDDIIPGARVRVEHSISKGFYCEIDGYEDDIELPLIFKIGDRMREIVAANLPIRRDKMLNADAIELFTKNGYTEKAKLFNIRPKLYTSVYYLNDAVNYFFNCLVPRTGYLKVFDLVKYYKGMLLRIPKQSNPSEIEDLILQDKMFEIFQEYKDWGDILGVSSVASINDQVRANNTSELIRISEALHEKKVAQIADQIYSRRDSIKIVLLSGPSSSGKTTTAMRLAVQLKVNGLKPHIISLDNYFVNREQTPRDENGEYDFESINALDTKKINDDLVRLLNGEEIELPKFSFETGQRFFDGTKLQIEPNGLLIFEGIHALNPDLLPLIDSSRLFKIYVSALTSLSIDGTNRIPTTDNRLLRRMVRDYRYRGYSAVETIGRWQSVRKGEDRNIFPFQENADAMFNSSLLYEFGVLKSQAEQILKEVAPIHPEYDEASRLLKFLSYILPISDKDVPPTSILREFLGGSNFSYK